MPSEFDSTIHFPPLAAIPAEAHAEVSALLRELGYGRDWYPSNPVPLADLYDDPARPASAVSNGAVRECQERFLEVAEKYKFPLAVTMEPTSGEASYDNASTEVFWYCPKCGHGSTTTDGDEPMIPLSTVLTMSREEILAIYQPPAVLEVFKAPAAADSRQ